MINSLNIIIYNIFRLILSMQVWSYSILEAYNVYAPSL